MPRRCVGSWGLVGTRGDPLPGEGALETGLETLGRGGAGPPLPEEAEGRGRGVRAPCIVGSPRCADFRGGFESFFPSLFSLFSPLPPFSPFFPLPPFSPSGASANALLRRK